MRKNGDTLVLPMFEQYLLMSCLEPRQTKGWRALWWPLLILPSLARGFYLNLTANLTFNAPWTVGEWLINYAGGFTRRGAPGLLIYHASLVADIAPWILAAVISVASWISLAVLLLVLCGRIFRGLFIFSPFVLLAPLIGEYLVRKDCLNLALLGASIMLAKHKNGLSWKRIIAINLLGIAATLSHESYVFYAFPALYFALIVANPKINRETWSRGAALFVGLFSPVIISSVFCFYFHGNLQTAESIQQSWILLSDRFPSDYPPYPMGAIAAIGWSLSYGFSYTTKPILFELANGFIWRPLALVASVFVLLVIVSSRFAIREEFVFIAAKVRQIFASIFLSMIPIFVIGHDYGRWLFMITVATMFASAAIASRSDALSDDFLPQPCPRQGAAPLAAMISMAPFFFGIPPYWNSWNLAWAAQDSWVGYIVLPLSQYLSIRFIALYCFCLCSFLGFAVCRRVSGSRC
jgi:hypothetical protein